MGDRLNSGTLRTIVFSGVTGAVIGAGAAVLAMSHFAGRFAGPAQTWAPAPAEAVFQAVVNGAGMVGLTAPEGARIAVLPNPAGGPPNLRLWGLQSNASSGGMPGIYLRLPAAFERAASGRQVRVTVVARRAAEAPSRSFAVAYSTNDVGNSGWRRFAATPEPDSYAFVYDVPPMVKGSGDFIGIQPDADGSGGAVQISGIRAEVLEDAPLLTSSTTPADGTGSEPAAAGGKVDFIAPEPGPRDNIKLTIN